MFKKYLSLFIFLAFSNLSFSSTLNCSIDKELNEDDFTKIKQYRGQALNVCLTCNGKECTMKSWTKEQAGDAGICRLLFCTAKSVSRGFKLPEGLEKGRSKIYFNYNISDKGKVKGIEINKVSGKMNGRDAYKYLTKFVRKTSFEPLIVDGKTYQISNLSAEVIANIGARNDKDKYNSADSKLWTN